MGVGGEEQIALIKRKCCVLVRWVIRPWPIRVGQVGLASKWPLILKVLCLKMSRFLIFYWLEAVFIIVVIHRYTSRSCS